MSTPYWYTLDKPDTKHYVKNLAWIIAHAPEVNHIDIWRYVPGASSEWECRMVAYLNRAGVGIVVYVAEWASYDICREWLPQRRQLRYARLFVDGQTVARKGVD